MPREPRRTTSGALPCLGSMPVGPGRERASEGSSLTLLTQPQGRMDLQQVVMMALRQTA